MQSIHRTKIFTRLTVLGGACGLAGSLLLLSGCGQGGGGADIAAAQAPVLSPPNLSSVTQNWDKNLPSRSRFTVLSEFGDAAVLDKETGLVWEQAPSGTEQESWYRARNHCINKVVGDRKGWRLPAIAELSSLVDPSVPNPGPTLPPGHPFTGVQSARYWSASTAAEGPFIAWRVIFVNGIVDLTDKLDMNGYAWCVRGPMQESVY